MTPLSRNLLHTTYLPGLDSRLLQGKSHELARKGRNMKKIWGKKMNVTTVKLLLKDKIQCFLGFLMPFCFKLYLKVNIHPFHDFLLIIA